MHHLLESDDMIQDQLENNLLRYLGHRRNCEGVKEFGSVTGGGAGGVLMAANRWGTLLWWCCHYLCTGTCVC